VKESGKKQPYQLCDPCEAPAVKMYRVYHKVDACGIKKIAGYGHEDALCFPSVEFHFAPFLIRQVSNWLILLEISEIFNK
jgi:hypothetical protein